MIGRDEPESMRAAIDAIERDAQLDALRSKLDRIALDDRDREALSTILAILRDRVDATDAIAFAYGLDDAFVLRELLIERSVEIGREPTDDRSEIILDALSYLDRASRAALAALGLDQAVAGSDLDRTEADRDRTQRDRRRPRRVDRFRRPLAGWSDR